MTDPRPEDALAHAAAELRRRGQRFALVGGLAISGRGEVRATRDVGLAVAGGAGSGLQKLPGGLGESGFSALPTARTGGGPAACGGRPPMAARCPGAFR